MQMMSKASTASCYHMCYAVFWLSAVSEVDSISCITSYPVFWLSAVSGVDSISELAI